ncbi:hypothetical protein GCM10025786_09160 [Nocardioides caeni]
MDLDALLDRVDVNHLLDRVDVNRLLDRIDVDRLLARADVNALLSDVELEQLVRRAGIPDIVAETTGNIAGRTLDVARRQVVGVDTVLAGVVGRILPRAGGAPTGPPALVAASTSAASATGRYAGAVSRLLALALDVAVVIGTYSAGTLLVGYLLDFLLGVRVEDLPELAATLLLITWGAAYFTVSTAISGRTIGKAVVGLRVVTRLGSPVGPGASLLRVLLLPLSTSFLGLGALLIVVRRDRRGLHDLLVGTCVVYDWGDRPAELPGPLAAYLQAHGA